MGQLITTASACLRLQQSLHQQGKRIGLVPTMGALHAGHKALIEASVAANDSTFVSIFVNPLQFAPTEDLAKYPQTLEQDIELATSTGASVIFAPKVDEIYAPQEDLLIQLPRISNRWEGRRRPGHFAGVATVVAKLFNLVRPHSAYFGHKDYEQTVVIRRLASQLFYAIDIQVLPTVRESDGLAMSSRNRYLNTQERALAPQLYQALQAARAVSLPGGTPLAPREAFLKVLQQAPAMKLEYVAFVEPEELQEVDSLQVAQHPLICAAVSLGSTRLIDNVVIFGD